METLSDIARAATHQFEIANRPDGSRYWRAKDTATEWIRDAIYAAHRDGEILPDDRIYELTAYAFEHIANSDAETPRDMSISDTRHEFADAMVDIYDADRLAWVGSDSDRRALADEAGDEMGASEILDRIACGQYREAADVFDAIAEAVERKQENQIYEGQESASATIGDEDAISAAVEVTR